MLYGHLGAVAAYLESPRSGVLCFFFFEYNMLPFGWKQTDLVVAAAAAVFSGRLKAFPSVSITSVRGSVLSR